MKRVFLFTVSLFFVFTAFYSCSNEDENNDKVKMVEMTIYPKTAYTKPILSSVWTDCLVYMESDDKQEQTLTSTITEGFDFEFESGYEYILNVKKITHANPYSLRFVLIDIKDKQKADMPEWLKH